MSLTGRRPVGNKAPSTRSSRANRGRTHEYVPSRAGPPSGTSSGAGRIRTTRIPSPRRRDWRWHRRDRGRDRTGRARRLGHALRSLGPPRRTRRRLASARTPHDEPRLPRVLPAVLQPPRAVEAGRSHPATPRPRLRLPAATTRRAARLVHQPPADASLVRHGVRPAERLVPVSYPHLRAHETVLDLV